MWFAVRELRVDGGERASAIERNAMALSKNGEHVGADLVGRIAVGRDPDRRLRYHVDFTAASSEMPRAVDQQGDRKSRPARAPMQ
jgi:hypothetical protein